jgi:L-ornithine N5-oxygenase
VVPTERIWHSHDLLRLAPKLAGSAPDRVAVVRARLPALHVPGAEACAIFARYGYSPADDSSFANRIFDPAAVNEFYAAPDAMKARLLDYHANTNYSVVDPALVDTLYRRHYHERVAGRERPRFLNMTRVAEAVQVGDRVELESLVDATVEVVTSDLVVYATDYCLDHVERHWTDLRPRSLVEQMEAARHRN